jgi:alkylation response protein AidB-like acyl-CoA dehydrogenase
MGASDDPLSAARALRGTILNARQETEGARRLSPSTVAGLIETGLCRLAVPADLGGYEAEPVLALKVYEELAGAEASVAWIAWNNSLPGLHSSRLNDSVRAELFGDRNKLFANSTRMSGRALAMDGGFRVTGRWALVSGCELADWIPVMCVVTGETEPQSAPEARPQLRMAYVPKGSYRVIDTWYVGGLRGTGSHDIAVEDVFVPAERTYSFADPAYLDRPLYRMPPVATLSAGCASICIGIAQAAIQALLALAESKVGGDPRPGLRDRPEVQDMVATSEAALDAARLLLHAAVAETWANCNQNLPVTDEQRIRVWSGANHAAKAAKAIVTSVYEAAGASALYQDCPLERAHRDVHAVGQHVVLGHGWLNDAGRIRLGLKANNPLFYL